MLFPFCLILLAFLVIGGNACPDQDMAPIGRRCYFQTPDKTTNPKSRQICKKRQAKLVRFEQLHELDAVAKELLKGQEKHKYWTSGKLDKKGEWKWDSKHPIQEQIWCKSNPAEGHNAMLVFERADKRWCLKSTPAFRKNGYICESGRNRPKGKSKA